MTLWYINITWALMLVGVALSGCCLVFNPVLRAIRVMGIATACAIGLWMVITLEWQIALATWCIFAAFGGAVAFGDELWARYRYPHAGGGRGLTFGSVMMGGTHTCGVTGGQARCWGANASSRLGVRDPRVPAPIAGGLVIKIDWPPAKASVRAPVVSGGCELRTQESVVTEALVAVDGCAQPSLQRTHLPCCPEQTR